MKNILIGGAWPYANGSLHIGHIAGLLPGDVLARYHRAIGDKVYFVSGSDCHGTPVAIRAKREGRTPREISDSYHQEFVECFEKLGFSYDVYTKTSSEEHKSFVRQFHAKLYESPYVYEKTVPQAYCQACATFLADRFVIGKCPKCQETARGDQCDACGAVLEPEHLLEARCALCGKPIAFQDSRHLYIAVSRMERQLRRLVEGHPEWRRNAVAFTERYLDEGLRDRALTRDLDWGISVPKAGYEDKTIYIWAENVLGYLSASKEAARKLAAEEDGADAEGDGADAEGDGADAEGDGVDAEGDGADAEGLAKKRAKNLTENPTDIPARRAQEAFETLWGEEARHYYVHGKDNIPFHTIILPALLIAAENGAEGLRQEAEWWTGTGGKWHLPDRIVSSEYMTLEGRKISTSQNYAIWVKDLLQRYEPDSIRYYFLANGPEKKDADFSWREYVYSHNGELLGNYGNFVNRTLSFILKYWDGIVPSGGRNPEIEGKTEELFSTVGRQIEKGAFKDALGAVFGFARFANRFFDAQKPWATREVDETACKETLFQCVQMTAGLAVLLWPFLPFSSEKVCGWLGIDNRWKRQQVPPGHRLPEIEILFRRIDKKVIEEESGRLQDILKEA